MTHWLRTTAACAHLGVSRRTLYRWRCAGLPYHLAGGTVLYDAAEVDRWVKERQWQRSVLRYRRTA